MKTITFVTGNAAKADYLKKFCDYPFKHKSIDLPEIQSLDLAEIVLQKAKTAYAKIKKPVLVEDVSLVFQAMGNALPGPLIKWFLQTLGNRGLCRLADQYKNRSAVASVCYCLYDGKKVKFFSGSTAGKIAPIPKGGASFGWNPVFIPKGASKTWAQMSDVEYEQTAMRTKPLAALKKYVKASAKN